ncbi:MAG: creatininase family protein [Gemmatimonadetes bacterium]|nr:creatininase family protein [Gemmatimonadota bacterium]
MTKQIVTGQTATEGSIPWWQSLTTAEVGTFSERDPVAVLPLAAIEQHGPHLPLSTDLEIGLGLLEAAFDILPDGFPARVLPPQAVGCSREHARFPGTLSVEPELLCGIIERTGKALASCGVRRLVLSNSHGGNRSAMDEAGLRLRDEYGLLVVKASWFLFPHPDEVALPQAEWRHGIHGGTVETAMMMHLRPELVREDHMCQAPSLGEELEGTMLRIGPVGSVPFSWLAGDLNPSGAVGDARRADARLGARLVSHFGGILAEVIRDARAFPLDRLI